MLLLIGRFLATFAICLYVRVGFDIASHCQAGQDLWCAGAVVYAPLCLLQDLLMHPRPHLLSAVPEFSVAAVVFTVVWTIGAGWLGLHPSSPATAASLGQIANSCWFMLGLFCRLAATFTACLVVGAALLMAPHCLNSGMCILVVPLAPLFAFYAPPDSMDAGLPALLSAIWIATFLGTTIWTVVSIRRRRWPRARAGRE